MHHYSLLEHLLFPPVCLNMKRLRQSLNGKTILITGASSGIGEQVACMLADVNAHLILTARSEDKLLALKEKIEQGSTKVSVVKADLRNTEEVDHLLSFIFHLPDGLDIFISNAGKSIRRSIFNSLDRYHDFTRTMAVNYSAPVRILLSVIPLLQKNHGHIINVSTVNALLLPVPRWAAYQASKAAFDTFLRSAAPELNGVGISTTAVYLPLVKTPMILPTPHYQKVPAMSPEHVAKIILKALYTGKRKFKPWWLIFGQLSSVIFRCFWDALMPRFFQKKGDKNL